MRSAAITQRSERSEVPVTAQDPTATTSEASVAPTAPGRRHRSKLGDTAYSAVATTILVAVLALLCEIGPRAGWWREDVLPTTSSTVISAAELLGQPQFWGDAGRTSLEIGLSIVFGSVIGLLLGLLFWKLPTVGRIFEPYLVSFYAVPMVLFYPLAIVVVGINASSVVILATIMATIPVALNTTVGLNGIRPVYLKLARSLQCSPRQLLTSIALPAAAPFIVAGLRLGVVYALIGSIAMEFVTAQAGLGYRIRYLYEIFDNQTMFAYIFVVLVVSMILTAFLVAVEKLLVKGRTQ